MKKIPALGVALFLSLCIFAAPLQGQNLISSEITPPALDKSEFPQWTKDLRRAEIIAFGTFPFTMFTATFAMDTWRTSQHNWDTRYAPWPLKTAGAIEMTRQEHELVMMSAAAASVFLALADLVIVKLKRHRVRQQVLQIPEGTPIIIKRPLPGAEDPDDSPPPDSPPAP
jgi:hypothetical protein